MRSISTIRTRRTGLIDKPMDQGQDPSTPSFRFFQIKSWFKEVMVPHESSIPFPVLGTDSQVGLERVGDVVRIRKVKVFRQVDRLKGVDHLGLLSRSDRFRRDGHELSISFKPKHPVVTDCGLVAMVDCKSVICPASGGVTYCSVPPISLLPTVW